MNKIRLLFLPSLAGAMVFSGIAANAKPSKDHAPTKNVITLEAAYDRTLATDQSIRVAYQQVLIANLQPWSALTKLGVQVAAGANFGHSDQTTHTDFVNAATGARIPNVLTNRSDSGGATLSVLQPIIDLTVFPAYKLGKLTQQSKRLAYQYTIREILFGVASAYYQVLEQQAQVTVAEEALKLADDQFHLANDQMNAGVQTRSDVLQAQLTMEMAKQTLIAAQNTLRLNRNTLAQILNLGSDDFVVSEPRSYPTKLQPFESLVTRAYARREDYRVAQLLVDEDKQTRNITVASYAPSVSAAWNGEYNNSVGDTNARNNNWSATVSVSVPIFTGGQRELTLISDNYQIRADQINLETSKKNVQESVKQSWLAVDTLEQTLKEARAAVKAAEQSYEDLVNEYKAGTARSVDVLTGLNNLIAARSNLVTQTYAYQVALRNVDETVGTFQEQRVQRAKKWQ